MYLNAFFLYVALYYVRFIQIDTFATIYKCNLSTVWTEITNVSGTTSVLGVGVVDNFIRVVYLMNMTNVSFLERFLCFLMGNWSMILSISYCRKFQHSIVVLSLSMLFQSSFV